MKKEKSLIGMILLITVPAVVIVCQNMPDKTSEAKPPESAASALPIHNESDIPAPATNTAEMLLGNQRFTLVKKTSCNGGANGIGFEKSFTPGEHLPSLYVHNADFSAPADIVLKTGAPSWYLDMPDVAATWQTVVAGCPATISENTATIFELKTMNCQLKNFKNTLFTVVSFRARCVKD